MCDLAAKQDVVMLVRLLYEHRDYKMPAAPPPVPAQRVPTGKKTGASGAESGAGTTPLRAGTIQTVLAWPVTWAVNVKTLGALQTKLFSGIATMRLQNLRWRARIV